MNHQSNQLTLAEQIIGAFRRTGWTHSELANRLAAVGVTYDRSTLRRKMIGEVKFSTDQAEVFAGVFGITLAWVPGLGAQRRRAA